MFELGMLEIVVVLVFLTTYPIIHYAEKRSRQVTSLVAVSTKCLFTYEYCIVAVRTVNKSVSLKVMQFGLFCGCSCFNPALPQHGGGWSFLGITWHRSVVDRVKELTWGRETVIMEALTSVKQTLVDSA